MIAAPPYLISYFITRKYNLRYNYCYSDAVKESYSDRANLAIKTLTIYGDEPSFRDEFYQHISYTSAKGLRVVGGNNMTHIDRSTTIKMREAGVKSCRDISG